MENRRLQEDITVGFGNYLTQKDQQRTVRSKIPLRGTRERS